MLHRKPPRHPHSPRFDETQSVNPAAKTSIAEGEYYGMQTFDQSLLSLNEQGVVEISDPLTAASNPHDLTLQLRRRGLLTVNGNGTGTRASE